MNFSLPNTIEILRQTPKTLEALLGDISSEWVDNDGDQTNWDPVAVVGHLIHADETDWIPRAEVILAQDGDRRFPDFDRFGQFEKYTGRTLHDLLGEFGNVRNRSIEIVADWDLTDEKLSLTGVHPEFGEVTLRQLLATWTVHDLGHIRQIVTFLASHYSQAVGPWKQYLSILK